MSRPDASPASGRGQRRQEIHGLRGLAIALVIAYHLWGVGRVSGGVDIFLMISAYLMTLSFVRQGERFDAGSFLVRRFRQLLPQAAVVIVATVIASFVLLAPTRMPVVIDQSRASLLYYQNWVLIDLATDYNSPDRSGTSPLQHFWSLSMQGQVFVAWALVMALAAGLAKALKIPVRATLTAVFGLLALASMTYAFRLVATNPVGAYFNTFARIWEFALASLLALAPGVRLAPPLARVLGWAGLAAIVTCGMTVGRMPFPGPAALLPSLAAAAVVLAGSGRGDRSTAAWWLSTRPFKFLGDRAYGLYLWHWPIYMIWLGATGETSIGALGSLVVIVLAVALADLSTRVIERRFNQWGVLQTWPAGLVTIATIVAVVFGGVQLARRPVERAVDRPPVAPAGGGAAAATPGVRLPTGQPRRDIAPGDAKVADDWPDFPACPPNLDPAPPGGIECSEIPANGAPARTVVLVGDSHSKQWVSALLPIAKQHNWRVLSFIRPRCRVALPNKYADQGCVDYGRASVDYITRARPDLVLSVGTRSHADQSGEEAVETYSEVMRPVLDANIRVVNIRDNPRWSFKVPECVQQFGSDLGRCTRPVSEKLAPVSPLMALDPRMGQIDLTEQICPGGVCNAVIGDTYVYMDDNHLSRTYVQTLRPALEEQLFWALGR
ncbi:acyltransferase family protein [Mariniluteicoccus flavus]